MKKLKSIEINELANGQAFADGVYRKLAETEYTDDDSELIRERLIEPMDYYDVLKTARRMAQAANCSLVNYVALNAEVPFVESLAKMKKG